MKAPPAALVLVAFLIVAVPVAAAGVQIYGASGPYGCASRLWAHDGPLKVRLFYEEASQAAAMEPRALAAYLTDRMGREVLVTGVQQADEAAFRAASAWRPFTDEALVFLMDAPLLAGIPGQPLALGVTPVDTACAYVAFQPAAPTPCALAGDTYEIQQAFATVAHELGHMVGLGHTSAGIMGHGAYRPCAADTFSPAEQARIAQWGSS